MTLVRSDINERGLLPKCTRPLRSNTDQCVYLPLRNTSFARTTSPRCPRRIFELQEFNIGSLLVITGLFPLTWLATPFLRPSLRESLRFLRGIVSG